VLFRSLGQRTQRDDAPRRLKVGQVGNQRIEVGPSLGFEYTGRGLVAGGVSAQSVDGFGWKRDQFAGP